MILKDSERRWDNNKFLKQKAHQCAALNEVWQECAHRVLWLWLATLCSLSLGMIGAIRDFNVMDDRKE